MTSQEPKTSTSADPDAPDTQVMVAPASASPVFVDSTGRRGRRLRRASYAFGVLCMLYGTLVSVSLAGGPLSPGSVLPLRALADGAADLGEHGDDARPSPLPQPVATSAAPEKKEVNTVLPRRAQPIHTLERAPAPPKPPAAKSTKATPKATPSTSRPATPTATPKPTAASPSNTPSPSAPPTKTPPPPKPPASTTGTGGTGGGTEVSAPDDSFTEFDEVDDDVDKTGAPTATPSAPTSAAGGSEVPA